MASLELTQRVLLQACTCVRRLVHKPIYTSNNGKSRRGPHIEKGLAVHHVQEEPSNSFTKRGIGRGKQAKWDQKIKWVISHSME